jgi:dihydrofolate reductase
MRRVRYQVACSVDGYIAGPDDDFDWIPPEPTFDFDALHAQFDTLVMGRRTYEVVRGMIGGFGGKRIVVASRTLRPAEHPGVEVVGDGLEARVRELRAGAGLDIWLYGGGALCAQLLAWDLVDTVEPAILPILLGDGVPLLPAPAVRRRLTLTGQRAYPGGMVLLEYAVERAGGVAPCACSTSTSASSTPGPSAWGGCWTRWPLLLRPLHDALLRRSGHEEAPAAGRGRPLRELRAAPAAAVRPRGRTGQQGGRGEGGAGDARRAGRHPLHRAAGPVRADQARRPRLVRLAPPRCALSRARWTEATALRRPHAPSPRRRVAPAPPHDPCAAAGRAQSSCLVRQQQNER